MGIVGDIINIPIRILKLPFKIILSPAKIAWHVIFGSKKEQIEQAHADEKAAEKKKFEEKREELLLKAQAPAPFYMSGHPDDMKAVCGLVDLTKADEKVQAICKAQKGGRKGSKTRRKRVKKYKKE